MAVPTMVASPMWLRWLLGSRDEDRGRTGGVSAQGFLIADFEQGAHARRITYRLLDEQPAPQAPRFRPQLGAAAPAERDQRSALVGGAATLLLQRRAQHGQVVIVAEEIAQVLRLPVARLRHLRPDRRQQPQMIAVVLHPLAPLVEVAWRAVVRRHR